VLNRAGGSALAAICDEPVRLALDRMTPSGAIPTWIFSSQDRGDCDDTAKDYVLWLQQPEDWVQVEVVANLCVGLLASSTARYAGVIAKVVEYIASEQEADGHWESSWYDGPFYGTYISACAIASVREGSKAHMRAVSYLLGAQRPDGGWGASRSDPLSTALSVLTLATDPTTGSRDAIRTGQQHLIAHQSDEGNWQAVPWMAFGTPYGFQTYGSQSITTAFALRALLA
jgi:hypothetical protein